MGVIANIVAREAKGWSLVSNALISQIETGKVKDPGFSTVVRLARVLGLSLDRCAAPYVSYLDNKDAFWRSRRSAPSVREG